jgi:hypothetical protein
MKGRIRSVRWVCLHVLDARPFERRLAHLNAVENLVNPDVGDLYSYLFRRLETLSRNGYLNLTDCTDGSKKSGMELS